MDGKMNEMYVSLNCKRGDRYFLLPCLTPASWVIRRAAPAAAIPLPLREGGGERVAWKDKIDVLLRSEGIGGLSLSYCCCAFHGIYGVPLLPLPTVAGGREGERVGGGW